MGWPFRRKMRVYDDTYYYGRYVDPYATYGPFRGITLLLTVALILATAFSFACALIYLSEVAEEHPTLARRACRYLTIFVFIVHVAVMVVDQLSLWRSLMSLGVITLYWLLQRRPGFPQISYCSRFLALCGVGSMVETIVWYMWCDNEDLDTWMIVAFLTLLWIVPISIVAMTAVDDTSLPGGGCNSPTNGLTPSMSASAAGGSRKRSLLGRIAGFFRSN